MKFLRLIVGGSLVVFAQAALWAARTLNRIGLWVLGRSDLKTPRRRSVSRLGVLTPHTVETRDGRRITLYSLGRKSL